MMGSNVIARLAGIAAAMLMVLVMGHATVSVGAQQRDQRAAPVPPAGPTGTAVLSGVVTSEDGGRPVRFAYLVLLGTATGTVKVSASDADGRFMFANLPADRYVLGASKPPYLGTVAGARRPGRSGTPIALTDGQKVSNVAIRMPLGAAISGTITDERGQPAANTGVALRQLRMQGSERTLVAPPGAREVFTDERGRYRFYGLLPGEYFVTGTSLATTVARPLSATEVDAALRGGAPSAAAPPPSNVRYATVYFPGTTRANNAMPVAVGSGEERSNIDFKLELVQTARVEGSVMTGDGQIATGRVVLFTTDSSPLQTALSSQILPDGRFSFANVMPGTYGVRWTGPAASAGSQYAMASIEVAGADVLGVQLTLKPMITMPGRMEFRGSGATPALAGRRVPVRALTTLSGVPTPTVTATTETGAFTISNILPGTYVIGAPLSFGPTTDSITWALDAVMLDGRDVTDRPIEITAESQPKDLVVTYSDRYQELTGKLARADGAPVSEHTIIVFPEDRAYWVTGSRRIVTTRPGTDGRFTLSGAGPTTLPAGKYLLAAVTDIDRNEQFDPAFLASIAPAAVPLTLQPGEKKAQDLIVR